jgi:hypothetical protein
MKFTVHSTPANMPHTRPSLALAHLHAASRSAMCHIEASGNPHEWSETKLMTELRSTSFGFILLVSGEIIKH